MSTDNAKTIFEQASENPVETFLLIIGALILVALFAGAKKAGEAIAVGPKAIRGFIIAFVVLIVIVLLFIWNRGECPEVCNQETMSLEEYGECRKCKGLPE